MLRKTRRIAMLIVGGILTIASAKEFKQEVVTPNVQIETAKGIIERLMSKIADRFTLEMIPKAGDRDVFEIESKGETIVLRGSTGVALASAFNRYLKEYCKCHVSWCGDQLNMPSPLPKVPEKVRVLCLHKHRVYLLICWPGWVETPSIF